MLLPLALLHVLLGSKSLTLCCAALRQLRPAASDLGNGSSTQDPPQPDPRIIQTSYWERPQDSNLLGEAVPEPKAPGKPAVTTGIINKVCFSEAGSNSPYKLLVRSAGNSRKGRPDPAIYKKVDTYNSGGLCVTF